MGVSLFSFLFATRELAADSFIQNHSINDNAALGRITSVPGVDAETLETCPMLVQGLGEEDFKAVRVAAGDSVSLAISDNGELRCWGSFRVS